MADLLDRIRNGPAWWTRPEVCDLLERSTKSIEYYVDERLLVFEKQVGTEKHCSRRELLRFARDWFLQAPRKRYSYVDKVARPRKRVTA